MTIIIKWEDNMKHAGFQTHSCHISETVFAHLDKIILDHEVCTVKYMK